MSTMIATPLEDQGIDLAQGKILFAEEVLAAFERRAVTMGRHIHRSIPHGTGADFPIMGRTVAKYLKPGDSLDAQREKTNQTSTKIVIDGLLTTDHLITDLHDAMTHFDVRGEYARQQGEALAISMDASVLAEIAKMAVLNKENLVGLGKSEVFEKTIASGDYGATEIMGLKIYQMLLDIATRMDYHNIPDSDRITYMKPEAHRSLAASFIAIDRRFGATASITEGNVIRLAGFDIISTAHLTKGGDDNSKVLQGEGHIFPAAFTEKAVMLAGHRTSAGLLTLKDIKVEHARRPEYQADQVISSCSVGTKALRPEACFMGALDKQ